MILHSLKRATKLKFVPFLVISCRKPSTIVHDVVSELTTHCWKLLYNYFMELKFAPFWSPWTIHIKSGV